jgi:hypothetical protein
MKRLNMTGFLSVNRSLMTSSCEIRQLRLPRSSPFPKLNSRAVLSAHGAGAKPAAVTATGGSGVALIRGDDATLPEMTTDMVDRGVTSAATGNVRRERASCGRWLSLGQWMGRMVNGVSGVRRQGGLGI